MKKDLEKILEDYAHNSYEMPDGIGNEDDNLNEATEAIMKLVESKVPKERKRVLKPMLESEYVLWKQCYNECRRIMLDNLGIKEK